MTYLEKKTEKQVEVVQLVSIKEIEAMNEIDKMSYLKKLTTEQYESLPISGGYTLTTKADYLLSTFKKRSEWVDKTIENSLDEYAVGMNMIISDGRQFGEQKTPRALDFMGSYLLESLDILSPRSLVEYPFYVDERAYESRKHNRDVITFDTQEAATVFEEGESINNTPEFGKRINRLLQMLVLDEMTYDEKRRLVTKVIKEKNNVGSELQQVMTVLYEDIISNVKKKEDVKIIDLLIEGKTESDISKIIGSTQPNINKKIKRIINYIGKK
ncbi:hypothetical protein [Enterococcus mundtii]|uniref:hypothetical protein n=1 Tax=Enterococcus mundtii TaxID=53346 RepID=UPI001A95EB58|nr:hypothetical protein [Enterococcus mundtii]MBO1087121.1 hypothetical protein [Enterococcus mundtii]